MSRPALMCTILSSLGGPKALLVPQGFVPPTWHTAPHGKRPHTHQGRAPLMNQALDAHLSDVGLLAPNASPTPSEESRPWLRYHLSCPTLVCTILSSLGGPKALLVPQGFVPPTRHTSPRGKRPYTLQGRALLMNQALDAYLSDVGLLAPSASPTPLEESHPHRLNECLELGS